MLVDCWTSYELLNLELGDIRYALKDLANASIWGWAILDGSFHLLQTLSAFGLSYTLSLWLIVLLVIIVYVWCVFLRVCQGIFHMIRFEDTEDC